MHALFCRKVTQIQIALNQLISEKDVVFGLVYSYTKNSCISDYCVSGAHAHQRHTVITLWVCVCVCVSVCVCCSIFIEIA